MKCSMMRLRALLTAAVRDHLESQDRLALQGALHGSEKCLRQRVSLMGD